jgi:hypothetical protein
MNIIFICGSVEPGKDGVGDYTRRLAGAFLQKGYVASIVALNDKLVNESIKENQYIDDQIVPVLRLSHKVSYKKRLDKARDYIDAVNPEWLSLQYVPFSFHKKGLAFSLGNDLREISGNRKWHIMCHELWCGMNIKAHFKERVLGYLQKLALKKITKDLKASSIFTSLLSYKHYLSELNITPLIVPIYSNIGTDLAGFEAEYNEMLNDWGFSKLKDNDAYITLGIFGSIYQTEGIEDLILQFYNYAEINDKKIMVLIIGDGRGLDISGILGSKNIIYKTSGRLPEALLDKVLKLVDAGIMSTTADGLDKSGSAIAFLERKIPVVVAATDNSYQDSMKSKGLYQVKGLEDAVLVIEKGKYFAPINRLENAVSRYINTFNK